VARFLNSDNTAIAKDQLIFRNLRRAPLPHLKGTNPGSVFGGWNLMVSKFSSRIPEAVKFAQFLVSEEAQKIMFENGGYLPVNRKIYTDSSYTNLHPELLFYFQLLQNGVHRPFLEQYTTIPTFCLTI
jgi:multiple sugar transport system substrate-binding protein